MTYKRNDSPEFWRPGEGEAAVLPEKRGPNQFWEARFDPATNSVRGFCKVCDAPYPGHTPACALSQQMARVEAAKRLRLAVLELKAFLGGGGYHIVLESGKPMGIGEYFPVAGVLERIDKELAALAAAWKADIQAHDPMPVSHETELRRRLEALETREGMNPAERLLADAKEKP